MTKRAAYGIAAGAVLALAAVAFVLPVEERAVQLVEWFRGAGALGAGVFALAYLLATLYLLPGAILTLGAGFAYGPLWGTLLVSPVSVAAATMAFLMGRSLARRWVARRLEGHSRFAAIDRAVGENGFKVVFLLRLSPVLPFNLLNYALGLTRVRLRDYVAASLPGMLPGTLLYVYLGSLATSAGDLANGRGSAAGGWSRIFYWGGLMATILVTMLITRIARRALERAIAGEPMDCLPAPSEQP